MKIHECILISQVASSEVASTPTVISSGCCRRLNGETDNDKIVQFRAAAAAVGVVVVAIAVVAVIVTVVADVVVVVVVFVVVLMVTVVLICRTESVEPKGVQR